jgi:hypothetical protein
LRAVKIVTYLTAINYGIDNPDPSVQKFYEPKHEFIVDRALINHLENNVFKGATEEPIIYRATPSSPFLEWLKSGVDDFMRAILMDSYPNQSWPKDNSLPYFYVVNEVIAFTNFLRQNAASTNLGLSMSANVSKYALDLFQEERKQFWAVDFGTSFLKFRTIEG